MPLFAWILSIVAPLVVRGVIALGFTAVTFTGVTAAASSLLSLAQTRWSGVSVDVLQIATLTGIPESLGIIAGAYVGRLAVWSAINGIKYVLKA